MVQCGLSGPWPCACVERMVARSGGIVHDESPKHSLSDPHDAEVNCAAVNPGRWADR